MSTEDKKRPHRTTMEGMIWNANHVLDRALDPNISGVPRAIFEMCRGVVLISVVEVGFIFSGSGGTGVVVSRNEDGSWSPPSAIGLGGVGFGFLFGADVKDILVVIDDESPMKSIANHGQIKLGSEMGLAVGPVGREVESQLNASPKGGGVSFAYAFSKGAFLGVGLEGAVLKSRNKENERFYGKKATPAQILFEGAVEIPENTMIPELHKKLAMLEAGKTMTLTMSEEAKKESMRVHAEEAGEAAKEEQDDVVEVNAEEEAAKEEAAKEEAAKEEAAKEEAAKEEAAKEDAAKEETPKEEAAKEETPKEEAAKEEPPKEEPPKEETPKEETPKEETA